MLGDVGIQLGVVFPQEFAHAVDIGTKSLVGAAADTIEAAQLAIGTATFQKVFSELIKFCIQFSTIRLAVLQLCLLGMDLVHAFLDRIEGFLVGHGDGAFLQGVPVFGWPEHEIVGDVSFIGDSARKDLDEGERGKFFIRVLDEEAQGAGAFKVEVV